MAQRGTGRPAELLSEVHALAARAASAGRPLRSVPSVEISDKLSSRAFPAHTPPRIRLSSRLLQLSPRERAWTIAHELSHVLRHQEGSAWRRAPIWPFLLASVVTFASLTGAVIVASCSLILSTLLVLLALAGAGGLTWWNVAQLAGGRRNESETDALAATVFGEVMTEEWVQHTLHAEGLSRYLPLALRSHPPPDARRRDALLAASGTNASGGG
ncbi:ImmA/IrrE family metallo-endopeptidase [Georgenia satyanarayanai]|uniref:M48 family metalloprotease n=1 Tax=Georgenia satyanarayanai TaxID=860221 RepID=UPI00203C788C|nr:M48 family metalloprotease [Georgenia satyanarayanai]MCM3662530.1 ImmA/IrrE family metallo-endopeptidase [Georgenia satyanarayanai]